MAKVNEPVARNGFVITGIVASLFIGAITLGWNDLKDAVNTISAKLAKVAERQAAVVEQLRMIEEQLKQHERETKDQRGRREK